MSRLVRGDIDDGSDDDSENADESYIHPSLPLSILYIV